MLTSLPFLRRAFPPGLILAFLPMSASLAAPSLPVFFGNYADAIRAADFDPATGSLKNDRAAAPLPKASFLARSADGRFLYAVAEAKEGAIHAYAIDERFNLRPLNSRPSEGASPCDVSLSPDGRFIAAANYTGGSVIVYRVESDGRLGEKAAFFQHTHATSVNPKRQNAPHAHGVTWAPGGRLLLVPDLGGDRVYLYAYEPSTGAFAPNPPQAWLDIPAGAGPRHAQFSPDGRHLYVINELANTVTVAAFDAKAAMFTLVENVATLPEDFSGPSTTAEILVHPAGHTVYASNRGADTIAIFARNADTGRLTPRGQISVPANPRHFTLSPNGRWLLCSGQSADKIAVFSVDPKSGALTSAGEPFTTPKPVCVRF